MDAPDRVLVDSVAEPGGEAPIDGARMVAALRASAVPLAAGVVLVTVLAFVISLATPDRYRATARIVQSPLGLTDASGDTDQRDLATSLAFLTTPAVRAAAARRVPGETAASLEGKVRAGLQSGADVIEVTATDGDPRRAAAIANAVANGFLEARAASTRAAIARTSEALLSQLAAGPPAAQATAIRTRLGDLAVQRANAGADLQVAELAQPPSGPYAPRPLRNAVVAFFAALFVGVVGVLVLERVRPRAGGARELGRLWGVRVLAALPAGGGAGGRGGERRGDLAERLAALGRRLPAVLERPVRCVVAMLERRQSARVARAGAATDEALHALLGAVLLDLPPGRRHVLLVTSARRGQGSACVAAGLARSLARAGQQTLALSVDLGSPALAAELGVPPGPGLARALEHTVAGGGAALHVVGVDGVAVVPHDGEPRDGIGLLRPGAVDALFAAIEASGYGFVVVDAPGLVSAPEARLAARHADAILLACPERVAADEVADAREVLRALDVPVLGVVAVAAGAHARVDHSPAPSTNGASRVTEPEARDLVARLRAADHPLTTAELHGAVGDLSTTRLRAQLRRLVERGEVERAGTGRPGDPYVYGVRDR